MNASPDLTISEVAGELRIRREAVVALLKAGVLHGYDVTPPGARRKSYRITRQALDAFKAERSAKEAPLKRRTRHVEMPNFVKYF